MTLLTLTPGSQSAANAAGHVIFYQLGTATNEFFRGLGFLYFSYFYISHVLNVCIVCVCVYLIWSLALLCVPHLRLG